MKQLLAVLTLIAVSGCTCPPGSPSAPTTSVPKTEAHDSGPRTHVTTSKPDRMELRPEVDIISYEPPTFWSIVNAPESGFDNDNLSIFNSGTLESPSNPILEPTRPVLVIVDPNIPREELFSVDIDEDRIRSMPLIDDRHR